ncbi:TetR/AcrR family transcriptional regulator [Gelidibacter salicanalis]|uniref:TetR/AcrR family transcriptional regulator n=1 Tax=Gelidibacter salicanalis TaxID=291193 RepID=A0A5C7AQS5_9FLAO|nr:TetR/AcrR family transcriptional regulator [Gelidibacter salicanalis]TXE08212.1 TetR/AcrR family transcriptional regulator [Gelidibacter salicanalis]
MTTKSDLLECSILNFTQFGSKGFTLDELASSLGISKKTIYKYFDTKEDLVSQSLSFLLDKYRVEITAIVNDATTDAIEKIILIYKKGFAYLKHFKPSFLFGIKKYYPKADKVFSDFSDELVHGTIFSLLTEAKTLGLLKEVIQIDLVCHLYFLRLDNIAFKNDNLFDLYSNDVILQHLIIVNLRGIVVDSYNNRFFYLDKE